jgi:serine protease AprX
MSGTIHPLAILFRIRWGLAAASLALVALVAVVGLQSHSQVLGGSDATVADSAAAKFSPRLTALASEHPRQRVEVIAQLQPTTTHGQGRALVRSLGGRVTGEVHIINALAARMSATAARQLAESPSVRAVSLNAKVEQHAINPDLLETSFNQSIGSEKVWDRNSATGLGVGVAVIDTGVAGNLADFRVSQTNTKSRVVASAVVNPEADTAADTYGHGTHVAGIIAGNSTNRASSDPLRGKYAGVAPDANLISVKVDDNGDATVLDAIYGLQFAVDFKKQYNIRVVNLSLGSTEAQSYKTDPLDAAVESAWFKGIVVVAAAGNSGSASDAVSYAPANDPYVISVGAVDDLGTKGPADDVLADWSSRGVTQDGIAKPEVVAPGAHIVSNLAPASAFTTLCPTCIVNGQYIRAGGTSMSAPMVSGAVANMLEVHPALTPNQVKGILMDTARTVSGVGDEIYLVPAVNQTSSTTANRGLTPNTLVNSATGDIDYSRSSWRRSSWRTASGSYTTGWARSSWRSEYSSSGSGSLEQQRSSWRRSSWRMSWTK